MSAARVPCTETLVSAHARRRALGIVVIVRRHFVGTSRIISSGFGGKFQLANKYFDLLISIIFVGAFVGR